MIKQMKIQVLKDFKSLPGFEFDFPDFVVLTGVNGSGKTHLLTVLSDSSSSVITINDEDVTRKITRIKYLSSVTLSPESNIQIDSQRIKQKINSFYGNYSQMKSFKPFDNAGESWEQRLSTYFDSQQRSLLKKIAKDSNKNISDLEAMDFDTIHSISAEFRPEESIYEEFSTLFKAYYDAYEKNCYNEYRKLTYGIDSPYISKEDFVDKYGEPPWELANRVLVELGLDYTVNQPWNTERDTAFELKLTHKTNGHEISFLELSSGEKTVMSLAMALYNVGFDYGNPEVLLLDEPDASLHPSMIQKLLDVIQNIFVKEKKIIVIITTHSPTTVALAPEESIYLMNKGGDITRGRIQKSSKDLALKNLVVGVPSFSVNYENRRQVFVESPNDVTYYDWLYKVSSPCLIPEISLSFISSGESRTNSNGEPVATCDQVKKIVHTLRKSGNRFVFGIIDWDTKNKSDKGVKVLGEGDRYSIESYIFDPLMVGALLLREKAIEQTDLGLGEGTIFNQFKDFENDTLQKITDFVVDKVFGNDPNLKKEDCVESELINGKIISIPKHYLHHNGHQLEKIILEAFPELNKIKKDKEEVLKEHILKYIIDDIPQCLSKDIIELFRSIQEV